MPLQRPQGPLLTCSSPPLAHPACPLVRRRLAPGFSLRMKPRLFDSQSVPLRPLVPGPSATRARALETEGQKVEPYGSTFCFSRKYMVVIVCASRHITFRSYLAFR